MITLSSIYLLCKHANLKLGINYESSQILLSINLLYIKYLLLCIFVISCHAAFLFSVCYTIFLSMETLNLSSRTVQQ